MKSEVTSPVRGWTGDDTSTVMVLVMLPSGNAPQKFVGYDMKPEKRKSFLRLGFITSMDACRDLFALLF